MFRNELCAYDSHHWKLLILYFKLRLTRIIVAIATKTSQMTNYGKAKQSKKKKKKNQRKMFDYILFYEFSSSFMITKITVQSSLCFYVLAHKQLTFNKIDQSITNPINKSIICSRITISIDKRQIHLSVDEQSASCCPFPPCLTGI